MVCAAANTHKVNFAAPKNENGFVFTPIRRNFLHRLGSTLQ
jgi:hypothetical protein